MRKDQKKSGKPKTKADSAAKKTEKKKPVKKLVTGSTEILDFNLDDEIETLEEKKKTKKTAEKKKQPPEKETVESTVKKSKPAADRGKEYGEKMPSKPVMVGEDTLELLDVEELLGAKESQSAKAAFKKEQGTKTAPKKEQGVKTAPKKEQGVKTVSKKEQSAKAAPKKEQSVKAVSKKEQGKNAGKDYSKNSSKDRKEETGIGAMDVIIALTGVLVLFVAAVTFGVYRNANLVKKQMEAVASVGEKMEEIGVAGEDILVAVADARINAREAQELLAETQETQEEPQEYEEKELVTEVSAVLKLTSVQKDLKIKFTNKKTGKLIGNQPFEVKIEGPEKLTKTDDDRDGIIYINSITPGDYTVTITAPAEIDGNQVAGIKGNVTVKDKIEYKKIDVTDEVKKESEINAAKEDTVVQNKVESVSTDTVEWVESTKTPLDGNGSGYEEVKKGDIPEPSAVSLRELVQPVPEGFVYFTQETTAAGSQAESKPEEQKPQESTPESAETPAESEPEQKPAESTPESTQAPAESKPEESKPAESTPESAETPAESEPEQKPTESTPESKPEQKPTESTPESKPEQKPTESTPESSQAPAESKTEPEVSDISLSADTTKIEAGKVITVTAKVSMTEGSFDGTIAWSVQGGQLLGSGSTVTVTSGEPQTVRVTAKAGSKEKSLELSFVDASGKTEGENSGEVRVDPTTLKLPVNTIKTIRATVDTQGDQAVFWKSQDKEIAAVVEQGDDYCIIETYKPGKVLITATSRENENMSANCTVTVEGNGSDAPLKDKDGNQLYYKSGEEYKAAVVSDYYKYDVFYRKKDATKYKYTGWQTIDGKRYYFDKNGNPVTGDQIIQGMKYSFNSDGSLKVNGIMGIDVSKHNGSIDWNAVKNSGVNYVIIRCGYRGSATGVLVEDPMFRSNIKGAAAAGLKVGIYFFSQAVNEVEAVEEASMVADLLRGYKISYPVYMDVEAANGRADGLDSATRTACIKAFCETLRGSGYATGIYANKTWLSEKMNVGSLGNYKIWLAQYATTPTYGGRYEMWQYTSKGKIAGISGDVDLNISYMSY